MREDTPHASGGGIEQQVANLEELFTVNTAKLKQITGRFVEELEEGLRRWDGNIPMNVTWVQGFPSGHEKGSFLTIDLGGTNIRICWITLTGKRGSHDIKQHAYQLPDEIKTGSAETLWSFIADSLESFLKDQKLQGTAKDPLPLAFTFSYPATQESITHGVLQRWTKGWDVRGVEGEDVVQQLSSALQARSLPVKIVALVNDTTGAMIASAYNDPATIIGAIFGTGCNAAYMDRVSRIPKIPSSAPLTSDSQMAINCEYGAFDSALCGAATHSLRRANRRRVAAARATAFRKIDLRGKNLGTQAYCLDTAVLSAIEDDSSLGLEESRSLLEKDFELRIGEKDMALLQRLAIAIATRGARLCCCGVAAICTMTGTKEGHVAADGSVANKHPRFKDRWAKALGEVLDWKEGGAAHHFDEC